MGRHNIPPKERQFSCCASSAEHSTKHHRNQRNPLLLSLCTHARVHTLQYMRDVSPNTHTLVCAQRRRHCYYNDLDCCQRRALWENAARNTSASSTKLWRGGNGGSGRRTVLERTLEIQRTCNNIFFLLSCTGHTYTQVCVRVHNARKTKIFSIRSTFCEYIPRHPADTRTDKRSLICRSRHQTDNVHTRRRTATARRLVYGGFESRHRYATIIVNEANFVYQRL